MRNVLLAVGLMTFTGPATSAPVPKALLKAKPEPTRISLTEAVIRAEQHTGLLFVSRLPAGDIELKWPWKKGEKPSLGEMFDTLNEQLQSHGYVLTRKTQSFSLVMIQK